MSSATSSGPPTRTRWAPSSVIPPALAAEPVWPHTVAPAKRASETIMLPTPPEAPSTTTRSSGVTAATWRTQLSAVSPATPMAAAARGATPSGSSTTASRGTTAAWAQTPSRAAPSPSPVTRTGRPSSSPAASAPSVLGRGPSGLTRPSAT